MSLSFHFQCPPILRSDTEAEAEAETVYFPASGGNKAIVKSLAAHYEDYATLSGNLLFIYFVYSSKRQRDN